ncbi:MAG: sulfite exporter TauE/SafE family protein [Myxococcota bacterium]
MEPIELALLCAGGLVAGIVNTLAGGGSLLTVPLLVFLGLPGTLANGTNRVGIVVQSVTAAWRFRAEGVEGLRRALPVLLPVVIGSAVGAVAVSRLSDTLFERLFGVVMVALLIPMLGGTGASSAKGERPWPGWLRALLFFGIGLYGGAFQAGVGIFLMLVLARTGIDLVLANHIKVIVIAALTAIAVPVFVANGQIAWVPALALTVGFGLGGALGARWAVRGGERLIRPVLALAVVAMAGRMLGLY